MLPLFLRINALRAKTIMHTNDWSWTTVNEVKVTNGELLAKSIYELTDWENGRQDSISFDVIFICSQINRWGIFILYLIRFFSRVYSFA